MHKKSRGGYQFCISDTQYQEVDFTVQLRFVDFGTVAHTGKCYP